MHLIDDKITEESLKLLLDDLSQTPAIRSTRISIERLAAFLDDPLPVLMHELATNPLLLKGIWDRADTIAAIIIGTFRDRDHLKISPLALKLLAGLGG